MIIICDQILIISARNSCNSHHSQPKDSKKILQFLWDYSSIHGHIEWRSDWMRNNEWRKGQHRPRSKQKYWWRSASAPLSFCWCSVSPSKRTNRCQIFLPPWSVKKKNKYHLWNAIMSCGKYIYSVKCLMFPWKSSETWTSVTIHSCRKKINSISSTMFQFSEQK